MSNLLEELVPKGPPDLCFESSAFTKESFSVDQFLQDHRSGGNLETMRDDLGIYLKVLRSAMIDLINKDYADYVNLSSNLMGLDKAIGNINAPLGQLKEELMQVNQYINNAISEMTQKLEQKKALRERKRSLRALSKVRMSLNKLQYLMSCSTDDGSGDSCDEKRKFALLSGQQELDVNVVERAVSEFSQLQFNSEKCYHLMSQHEKQVFEEMGEILYKNISKLFAQSLNSRESGVDQMTQCLSYCIKINRYRDLERFYRQRIVSPAMEPLINKENLKSLARGLSALYERILHYIDNDMKYLLDVTSPEPTHISRSGLNIYDFLLRGVWPEIEGRLQLNLASIYDVGDAQTFYRRYTETMKFLEDFSQRFKNNESREQWLQLESFSSFINKWNLPVYFQIRFQEIVKEVESGLSKGSEEVENQNDKEKCDKAWKLSATQNVWNCLIKCWSPGIFILAIADKMWKLTLQILSRYHSWIKQSVQSKVVGNEESDGSKFFVYMYSDLQTLIYKLSQLEEIAFNCMPSISNTTRTTLNKSLEECKQNLHNELSSIQQCVISSLTSRCCSYVKQVSDIPRLYRRTNRDQPTKPCPYVQAMMEPALTFNSNHSDIVPTQIWLLSIFSQLTKQYFKLVSEVLTSVQKTEESLRRLKKARDRPGPGGQAGQPMRTADDDKIRLQLLIDVTSFTQQIDSLGIKQSDVEQLTDLNILVETTTGQKL